MVPGINLLHDYLSIRIFEESETFLRSSAVDFLASPVKIFTRQRSSKGNVFSRVCLSFCLFGEGGWSLYRVPPPLYRGSLVGSQLLLV